eukprot:GHUV01051302.1.p1 GENE.GHUV01051302.1~~GHUV01051302.1.p1  ORF type:complete len:190 (-),score=42.63 GHUV01051302.1:93-662(-)
MVYLLLYVALMSGGVWWFDCSPTPALLQYSCHSCYCVKLHSLAADMLVLLLHIQEAKDLLEKFVIGKVKPGTKKPKAAAAAEPAAAAAKPLPRGPLVTLQDPRERYALPLAEKRQLNHDTFFMRFELPSPKHQLGLPCGKHVFLCAGKYISVIQYGDLAIHPLIVATTAAALDSCLFRYTRCTKSRKAG